MHDGKVIFGTHDLSERRLQPVKKGRYRGGQSDARPGRLEWRKLFQSAFRVGSNSIPQLKKSPAALNASFLKRVCVLVSHSECWGSAFPRAIRGPVSPSVRDLSPYECYGSVSPRVRESVSPQVLGNLPPASVRGSASPRALGIPASVRFCQILSPCER